MPKLGCMYSRLNSLRQKMNAPLEVFAGGETPDIIENTIKHNVTS